MPDIVQIQLRNDSAANWTADNPTLLPGEYGTENDTLKFKIGNGSTPWNSLAYAGGGSTTGGALQLNGSLGAPNLVSASVGITPLEVQRELQFIAGNGAATVVTASPPVANGNAVGQELLLRGCSDAYPVTLNNGTGFSINGPIVMGLTGAGASLYLIWDGTQWTEVSRR